MIDYIYNAQERVKLAIKEPDEQKALLIATIAQAEATVALAEQTRLQNVILWTTANGNDPYRALADEIGRKLGLVRA